MAIDSETSTYLSWEQVQELQLPPNTTVLVPPPPPADLTVPLHPTPEGDPPWLEDGYYVEPAAVPVADRTVSPPTGPEDPKAAQSASEREKYGDPALRLLTGLVATNAILERIQPQPKHQDKEEEKKKKK